MAEKTSESVNVDVEEDNLWEVSDEHLAKLASRTSKMQPVGIMSEEEMLQLMALPVHQIVQDTRQYLVQYRSAEERKVALLVSLLNETDIETVREREVAQLVSILKEPDIETAQPAGVSIIKLIEETIERALARFGSGPSVEQVGKTPSTSKAKIPHKKLTQTTSTQLEAEDSELSGDDSYKPGQGFSQIIRHAWGRKSSRRKPKQQQPKKPSKTGRKRKSSEVPPR